MNNISYTLKHSSRARRLRITVRCDASVVVTAPYFFSQSKVEKFLADKAGWVLKKISFFKKLNPIVLPKLNRVGAQEYRSLKMQAKILVREKIAKLNQIYNFPFNRVSIKNIRSRWGSCSKKGNLNFNYKIIHLPVELAEYIVAHEICHLKELNHSSRFWALVARAVPDYKARRQKLKSIFV
ncbi:MAG TPA: SprT family zinc-dependent metalloprotease [Candidatus Udaeobacter sp.]|nr:SprT family zinc-dependent metalloprotease [Candidatus Udaeobacter sp.]